eukprot:sb/3468858/
MSYFVSEYTPPTSEDSDSHSVDIGTTEVKMECPVPVTNPPSSAVWYLSDDADDASPKELTEQSNMMVVENTIVSSDSKYGYSNGMLIVMNFAARTTLSGASQALRIVSQVQGPDFLFGDTDQTTLECKPSNVDAGTTTSIYWQKTETENGIIVYKNLTGTGWTYSDDNRVLKFTKTNSLEGSQFRCQVIRGDTEILLNGFKQSPILPKTGYIPPGMGCSVNGTSYTADIDTLMSSDLEVASTQVPL